MDGTLFKGIDDTPKDASEVLEGARRSAKSGRWRKTWGSAKWGLKRPENEHR